MAILKDYDLSDSVYDEGPQRYSPHWARTLLEPRTPLPPNTGGHQTEQPTSGRAQPLSLVDTTPSLDRTTPPDAPAWFRARLGTRR
jgi:hypothetical protein